jgi:hypothetical protein
VVHEDRERRTLATVRDYLTLAPKDFADLLARMQDSHGAGGLIARAANRHLGKSDREAAGVLSSAQRHTHFLDSPRIVASTSASDFTFAGLKEGFPRCFSVCPRSSRCLFALAAPADRSGTDRHGPLGSQTGAARPSCSMSSPPWAGSNPSSAPWG